MDPADPTSPALIEPTANLTRGPAMYSTHVVIAEDYDGASRTSFNARGYALMFANSDGHLYKVYAAAGGSIKPIQVSSENQADQYCGDPLCGTSVYPDLADPEASQYLYLLSGADRTCSTVDDVMRMVRLNMDTSVPPINAYDPVMVLSDSDSGAVSGWLVLIGNNSAGATAVSPIALPSFESAAEPFRLQIRSIT